MLAWLIAVVLPALSTGKGVGLVRKEGHRQALRYHDHTRHHNRNHNHLNRNHHPHQKESNKDYSRLDHCHLPFEDVSTASWCDRKVSGGTQAPIATYGLANKDRVTQEVCKKHVWEDHIVPEDLGLPTGLRSPDGGPPIMLDVGGNMGVVSMLFAKAGYRVVMIEPMTQNRKLVNATLCANPDIKDLVAVEAAVVSTPEQSGGMCKVCIDFGSDASMLCPGDGRGPECDTAEPWKQKKTKELVKVKTLDEIVVKHKLLHIDVVKMDIEGYECQAIKGGQHLLNTVQPRFIMSELQNNPPHGALVGCTPSEFINMFRKAGYDVFTDRFFGKALVGDPHIDMDSFPNFFFVRQERRHP